MALASVPWQVSGLCRESREVEPLMTIVHPHRLLTRMGIDRAVGYTVIAKGWAALSGAVSLVLLTRFLSAAEQGFYFVFVDILALQLFFELGLSTVVMQFASHERARLEWTSEGRLEGDTRA